MPTIRQQMMMLLKNCDMSALDLSRALGIAEKEVYRHLPNVGRTVAGQGGRLVVNPFECRSCGFVFKNRARFSKPGRCPKCRGTHVEVPTYRIKGGREATR